MPERPIRGFRAFRVFSGLVGSSKVGQLNVQDGDQHSTVVLTVNIEGLSGWKGWFIPAPFPSPPILRVVLTSLRRRARSSAAEIRRCSDIKSSRRSRQLPS
jgi:hypothetical protein